MEVRAAMKWLREVLMVNRRTSSVPVCHERRRNLSVKQAQSMVTDAIERLENTLVRKSNGKPNGEHP